MADTTPNFGFSLPTVGGDDNVWGNLLNGNWSALDNELKALTDAITAALNAAEARKIPVGGLYLTVTAENPGTTLGYGTWVAHAAGRALVGVGDNGESNWAVNQTKGSETHALAVAELPEHTHKVDPPETNTSTNGAHTHDVRHEAGSATAGSNLAGSSLPNNATSSAAALSAGAHAHTVDIAEFDSGVAGEGTAHNNVQPSIAVFVWRRTA